MVIIIGFGIHPLSGAWEIEPIERFRVCLQACSCYFLHDNPSRIAQSRCDITGRTHLAKIGLQTAGMVAILGLYAFLAGAGFAGHVHVHIVPRWTGDTNFMPAFCGTKVISESLDVMYKIFRSK